MTRRAVRFSVSPPGGDRVYHVDSDDVRVVLGRLPTETYARLRTVHFNDTGRNRMLAYTTARGRREIALCALPPRISLTRFLPKRASPRAFGAQRGTQWPLVAIRRFLLYEVLLHEIGHLQVVMPGHRNPNREFASDTLAQEFAAAWRQRLWAEPFAHEDPAHHPPSAEELAALDAL